MAKLEAEARLAGMAAKSAKTKATGGGVAVETARDSAGDAEESSLQETLRREAEIMQDEMRAAGLKLKTQPRSKLDKEHERQNLKESELKVENAERTAKDYAFVMDGQIKDKRDMMGRGKLGETLFDFEASDTSSADYRKEGNIEFYTQANLRKRQAISCDRVVQKWLSIFWSTFSSVQETGRVHRAEYVQVHLSIAKALFDPEEWDEDDVREMVEMDWVRENNTNDTMDKARFSQSLFELVDTWASTIRLVEYRMFLQKLYFRITGSCADSRAQHEKYQQRLKELERQQRKLRTNMKTYIQKINALTELARQIAVKAKRIHDERIKTAQEARQCELEEQEQKDRMAVLKGIRQETDAMRRAKLITDAQMRWTTDSLTTDASDDSVAIDSLIAVEQSKLSDCEAKRQQIEDAHKKLAEAEAQIMREEQEVLEKRSGFESQMKSAEAQMIAIKKESSELTSALSRRTWAPLDQIVSMRSHSDASMLDQMRSNSQFVAFCSDNRLKIQEGIAPPHDVEADMRRLSYMDEDDDDDPEFGAADHDLDFTSKISHFHYEDDPNDLDEDSFLDNTTHDIRPTEAGKQATAPQLDTNHVDEKRASLHDDDTTVLTDLGDQPEPSISRPPADFTTWLESQPWNAWRGMCRGVSPPVDLPGSPVRLRPLTVDAGTSITISTKSRRSRSARTRRVRGDLPPIVRSISPEDTLRHAGANPRTMLESRSHPGLHRPNLASVPTSSEFSSVSVTGTLPVRSGTAPGLEVHRCSG